VASCREEDVLTVPGNHDVCRVGWDSNFLLQMAQNELRQKDPADIDKAIHRLTVEDKTAPTILLDPLRSYNEFALPYGCSIKPTALHWEQSVSLNDGSTLKIRGITSTLASNRLDNDEGNRLVVGTEQTSFTQEDGVEYLSMCHHPPSWLVEGDAVEERLTSRVRIQLFGHKHRQRSIRIEETVRISAGAVFPAEREPNWVPRYNLLALEVKGTGVARSLSVTVFPRIWNAEARGFAPEAGEDGKPWRQWSLRLVAWDPPHSVPVEALPVMNSTPPAVPAPEPRPAESKGDPRRRLAYRFLSLSFEKRLVVAQELDLLLPEDRDVDETERGRRFFARASDQKKLAALWHAVEGQHPDPSDENPFTEERP